MNRGVFARQAALLSCLFGSLTYAQSSISLGFNAAGLNSVQYGGSQYLSDGNFYLNEITFQNPDGSTFSGSTASTVSIDPVAQTETRMYAWGSIVSSYAVAGSRLKFSVRVSNQSTAAISEIWFQPISLILPSQAQEYESNTPLLVSSIGQPAIPTLTYTSGALAIADDDVTLPLLLGFPFASNRPTSTIFPLMINTGRVSSSSYPTSLPSITRPIAAGASDQYNFSLRFGGTGSTRFTLAADTLQAFGYAFPPTLVSLDHRSVGALILTTPALGYPTNPRGWFTDPTVDVTTAAGLAKFRTRVLTYAQNSASILQTMNAQGMVTWDIEGQQFPQSTSYVCDPAVFTQTAPEMASIADDYFQIFRNAGLKTGVCIRPQQFAVAPDSSSASQNYLTDNAQITQTLIDKATYARNRWGATLFYVDSNVTDQSGTPLDPSIFASLQAAFPDSLFFPEHANTQYWAYAAPYRQLNQGYSSTPPEARFIYPNSFTLINTADGPIQQDLPMLAQSVSNGDLLMYRAWFDDEPAHSLIQSIYQTAALPGVQVLVSSGTTFVGPGQIAQLNAVVIGNSNPQINWSVPSGIGSVSANGVYYAPVSLSSRQNITAVATSVADPTKSASIAITLTPAGVPVSATVASGNGQSAAVGSTFASALQAKVTDIFNNPVSGASVTFSAPSGSASASFLGAASANATTDVNGIAQSPALTAGIVVGPYNILASVTGALFSASYSLANHAGSLAAVVATTGAGQSTLTNSTFASSLMATAVDNAGNPVSNVAVTFYAPSTGASATFEGSSSLTVMTDSNGVASVPVVANGTAGAYVITASAVGATSASFGLKNTATSASGGVLTGVATNNSAAVNLTAEGSSDWVHWEGGHQDRKSGVAAQIGTYSASMGATLQAYSSDLRLANWTDGNPRALVANDSGGLSVGGLHSGFSIAVLADTTPRTFILHVGGYDSSAVLTASLSDGSAPVYSDTTQLSGSQFDRNYSITYSATLAGQLLTVTWTQVAGSGNVTLSAAALSSMSVIGTGGTPQTATVTSLFGTPLQVTARDVNNNLLKGVSVSFSAPATGPAASFGGAATASAITDSQGVATAPPLTANAQTGSYVITASVVGMNAPAAIFELTNAAGVPAALTLLGGSPQSASINSAFANALSVGVVDANNNPVSGASVNFAVQANGAGASFSGGLTSVNTTTYNRGTTTAPPLFANGQGGTFTVNASVAGVAPLSFALTNIAKTAASITAKAGTPQSTIISKVFGTLLQATVMDISQRPVSGVTVTFSVPASGPSASFGGSATAVALTNIYGIAVTPALMANALVGSYTVTASVAGATVPASFNLTNIAVPPVGTLNGSGTSSVTFANLTVEGTVDWVHWGDGSVNRKAAVAAQISNYGVVGGGGVPSYNNDPRPLGWTDGAPAVSSFPNTNGIYINSLNNGFTITAPADTTARKLAVHMGGWLSGATLTAHLSDGSAADYIDVTTPTGGQYDRNYTLIYSALSSAQTLTIRWVMSSGAGNVTLNGAALTLAAPSISATAGTAQSAVVGSVFAAALQATVLDAGSNPLPNVTVTFTAPASGASANFAGSLIATALTNSAGVATAPALTAGNQTGTYAIAVSAPGAASSSFSLTNTGGAAVSITPSAGAMQSTAVNTAFAALLQASVSDAGGNPVSGVTVTFTVPANGVSATFGALAMATAVTNVNGIATASVLTANGQIGSYNVTASATGIHSPASFALTNVSGPPTSISAVAGSGQSVVVNGAFATPLQAVVKDALGNLLSGVQVTFSAPSSGASGIFGTLSTATVSTNASGIATASAFTANSQAGSYNVTANVAGIGAPAISSLTNLAGPAASVTASAGGLQSATINAAFLTQMQAAVKDANNNPLSGVVVTFTAPATGASATFGGAMTVTAITNAGGIATAPTLTANNQGGVYSVTAAVSGVSIKASFSLTNLLGAPASVAGTVGSGQSATINAPFTPLQATVKDASGNLLSGVSVTFSSPASGPGATFGGLSSVALTTNASGVATAAATANSQVGSYNITASVIGVPATAAFALSNVAGPPVSLAASTGTPQSATTGAAFSSPLQATVKDAGNNPVSGVTVLFSAPTSAAGASFSGLATTAATTNSSGIATAAVITANGQTGSYNVVASSAGIAATANFALTNNSPIQVVPVSLVQQSAGANLGNNQNTLSVTLASAPKAANTLILFFDHISAAQNITSISGATWTRVAQNYTPNNGDFEIWAGTSPTSANITISGSAYFGGFQPGYAIVAEFAGISSTLDGSGVLTSGGNWPASTGSLSTSNASDLLLSATMSYNGGGMNATVNAPWNAFAPQAGTYSLSAGYQLVNTVGTYSATWNGYGNPQVPTILLALKAAAPSGPSISATSGSPQSTAVNSAFNQVLQATLVDNSGHALGGVTVTFNAPGSSASASFAGASSTTVTTNSSGVATAPALTANGQMGSYVVTASSAGTATPASFALTNTPGPPASIAATSGGGQTIAVGTAFAIALQATVRDAANNPVSGVTVTFSAPASGPSGAFNGSLSAQAVTNSSGIATAPSLVANALAGTFNATASAAGIGTSALFGLTSTSLVGIPATITASAGTPQNATVLTAFGSNLQALVKDATNSPISGISVTFNAPGNGPSASFGGSATVSSVTNASGIATSAALSANSQAGFYSVTANVTALSTSASYSLTNVAGAPVIVSATAGSAQSAAVNTAFTSMLQATVKDMGNNPVGGASVTFTAPLTGASATFAGSPTYVAITNASGIASAIALTANNQIGGYTVNASVNGPTSAAGFTLSNTAVVVTPSIAFVQQATGTNVGNNQNTLSVTLASAPRQGNALILFFDHVSAQQNIKSITGASWTQLAQNQTSNIGDAEIWIGTNPTSSTFTLTGSNYFGGFQPGYAIVAEFSGVANSLDGLALPTTSGIWPIATGSLITNNAADLLLTMTLAYNGGGINATVHSPWSLLTAPGGTYSLSAGYQIVNATGTYSANWNGYGSAQVATIILALK